jgi:hypothetical protein
MACDEHMFVEFLKDGRWQYQAPPDPGSKDWNEAWDTDDWGLSLVSRKRWPHDYTQRPAVEWHFGRFYQCYAYMAGVRNQGNIRPISPPRGLPPDVSPEVAETEKVGQGDNHSHTHFTLAGLRLLADKHERFAELIAVLDLLRGDLPDIHVRIVVWFDN